MRGLKRRSVRFETESGKLRGVLAEPADATELVVFVSGNCGVSNASREDELTDRLNEYGVATLAIDLLTPEEAMDRANRGDIELLCERISAITSWLDGEESLRSLELGFYASETATAAVLRFVSGDSMAVGAIALDNRYVDLTPESPTELDCSVLLLVDEDSAAGETATRVPSGEYDTTKVLRVDSRTDVVPRTAKWFRDELGRSEIPSHQF